MFTRPMLCAFCFGLLLGLCSAAWTDEEFVGPLAGWKNVKTDYGAIGDGRADDTAAIQRALDELRKHESSCVLYFPAGTYRITDTLKTVRKAHTECMGVSIVGEDPASTIIRWDGPKDGMMLKYDAWYSTIRRITLDGAGRAGVALAYGDAFSTYNETSDMVFQDVGVGMSMGTGAHGQAENAVWRCTFRRCRHGLQTNNFNSMDIWLWFCRFEDCQYGLYNNAGNFHAYGCLFLRSTAADIGSKNLMVFSFVANTSIGSRCFVDFAGGHTWGSPTTIAANRIIDPVDAAIRLGNGGPYLVLDNVIRSRAQNTKPAVTMTWADQLFFGNTYSSTDAVREAGRFFRAGERVVPPEQIDANPPKLPSVPPRRQRRIFELSAAADAAAIQRAIDEAARFAGQRPVIHLPKGTYKIDRTLVVPPGCDLQIVGDGAAETATVLRGTQPEGKPILHLLGPSQATIRDLSLVAERGTALLLDNCDQPEAKVFADQLNVAGRGGSPGATGLLVNRLRNCDVLLTCAQGGAFCSRWISVLGHPETAAAKPPAGQVSVFCGATGTADAQYHVAQGGQLVVRSVYHEMDRASPQGILLDDSGVLAIDATRFSYKTSPEKPLIDIRGFRGQFALLSSMLLPVDSSHPARVVISGDGSRCRVLCAANMFWAPCKDMQADTLWIDQTQPPAKAALLNCNLNGGAESGLKNGFGQLDNRGQVDQAFVAQMLAPLRQARLWLPNAAPPGTTNVRLYRLLCSAGKGQVCVELRAEK